MPGKLKHWVVFQIERKILRKAPTRLLSLAVLIGFVSLFAGITAWLFSPEHKDLGKSTWWAFLRLTDPGYLGDDVGTIARLISVVVTILGYLLFLGALIAVMTEWLDSTMKRLERGESPLFYKDHILILGYTDRTVPVIRQILLREGRVRRFLKQNHFSALRIVVLVEELDASIVAELQAKLGDLWSDRIITFRSGSSRNAEHLERVNFSQASVIIIPGDDYAHDQAIDTDTSSIKAVLTIANHPQLKDHSDLPRLVVELCDGQKLPIVHEAYSGPMEVITSESVVSRMITQNTRHPNLSTIFYEVMTHNEGDELYVRYFKELEGLSFQEASIRFKSSVVLGVVRPVGKRFKPMLNPPDDLVVQPNDRLVMLAKTWKEAVPSDPTGSPPTNGVPVIDGAACKAPEPVTAGPLKRAILILGWSPKTPAILQEFSKSEDVSYTIDICSLVSVEDRQEQLRRGMEESDILPIRHIVADYSIEHQLAAIDPCRYDNVVVLGSCRMESGEESDARTILGYLILRKLMRETNRMPDVLVELMDGGNRVLFLDSPGEFFISSQAVSHMLAQVALRPEIGSVFDSLFSAGDNEIIPRPVEDYELTPGCTFAHAEQEALKCGEIAIGLYRPKPPSEGKGIVELNPAKDEPIGCNPGDAVIVLSQARSQLVQRQVA